jgi:hypothetical protein
MSLKSLQQHSDSDKEKSAGSEEDSPQEEDDNMVQ